MTKKKSHLRRAPRHGSATSHPPKTKVDGESEESVGDFNKPIATMSPPLIAGSSFAGTVLDDQVRIRPNPNDPTQDYSMPRVEAMKLYKQGMLRVSNAGGFEATDTYPSKED